MVYNQKIYLGNFYPVYSSYIPGDLPFIEVAPLLKVRIEKAPVQAIEDKRKDEKIHSILLWFNKLVD